MTKHSVASLVIKLVAVYLVMSQVPTVLYMIFQIADVGGSMKFLDSALALFMSLGVPALFFFLLYLVIRKSDAIAEWVLGEWEEEKLEVGAGVPLPQVQILVIVCIGIWLVVATFPDFVQIVAYREFLSGAPLSPQVKSSQTVRLLHIAVQLALAVFLLARPSAVSALIARIQCGETGAGTLPRSGDGDAG